MEFSRQEYWGQLPFPTPGELPDPEMEPCVSCVSCIANEILYHCAIWKAFIYILIYQLSSSLVSDSLRHHGLQHTRPPCPSPAPRIYSNSCPLKQRCHPTISSSVIPFSSHLQSFPASGSFPRVSFSHQVAKILEFHLQHQSFQ